MRNRHAYLSAIISFVLMTAHVSAGEPKLEKIDLYTAGEGGIRCIGFPEL